MQKSLLDRQDRHFASLSAKYVIIGIFAFFGMFGNAIFFAAPAFRRRRIFDMKA